METYEETLEQYMPMIYKTIKRWNLWRNEDQYVQIGRIALYEAWQKYDEVKGDFAPLAQVYIHGRIRQELERSDRWTSRNVAVEPVTMTETAPSEEDQALDELLMTDWLLSTKLSARERLWLTEYVLYNLKPSEIAKKHNVGTETVKSWRKQALKKCRANVPIELIK
ncbi:sigma-70 family RNA polymerase sigma factor [Salisediminibacterium halotolerans]|uniref:sigma-70 family RNA polymerase sigma factor n=1 Tax=Salisediminibacterium halotolerans TaxID=517425 RepID=UPI000EAB4D41|nr:sigma-70 family RNA polymerase sigma factor [Salisediminibacterium halotolerans]RLJ75707.1 DNA-directed RNA polymerase [Actinophytocola xinjiangensis]RPE89561.1 DNA-directed RNA polymerase [Salisediminibacterium halotolerans]TWG36320.1 DNA-directed RNA polymerase [Salisediminibacterium halotolerans]GEL07232.1 hypothetical protein SHA02_06480 [Salisediminibacterium halotolerans]